MADYDLTRLGPFEFETLSQALVVSQFGPGTHVFGMGRDGGRDATKNGRLTLPDGSVWSGYTVIQVKFRPRPESPASNAAWLRNEVRKELNEWTSDRRATLPKPTNMLVVSNVSLSGVPGHGLDSLDKVFAQFEEALPLRNAEVWHYDHLCRLLDGAQDIRRAYAGLITPGDVLAQLDRILVGRAASMGQTIRRHVEYELLADQWIRLGQSGSQTNEKLHLAHVAMDLPLTPGEGLAEHRTAVSTVVEIGNRSLRPSVNPDAPAPHLVLVGGPGQGKTTVSQLISQVYRTALLDASTPQSATVRTALAAHRDGLPRVGVPLPTSRRWPLRIDLSSYADELSGRPETSVLRFLATRISDRLDETITPNHLRDWLAAWPWLLILDGFDEVASPKARDALVERVGDFLVDAETADADLLLIATTRPRGYAGEFNSQQYTHLTLADLSPATAVKYASTLAAIRLVDDPDAERAVMDRVRDASRQDMTARLMRTPLQVTIMSLLFESPAGVPLQRHGLFDGYYRTIYAREVAKRTPVSRLLELHQRTIDTLHNKIALEVQVSAESSGHADPAIPIDRVRAVALQLLLDDEHLETEAQELGTKLLSAATDRLVLLVPKNDRDVGFEIRSLQEFLAARAMTTGDDDAVLKRLRLVAPSSFWRNTWLLAAGRLASERPHLIDAAVSLLSDLDAESLLAYQLGLGPELAADLLDDGFGYPSPKITRLLVNHAIGAIQGALTTSTEATADALLRAAGGVVSDVSIRLRQVARQTAAAKPPQQITAAVIAHRWERGSGTVGAAGRQIVENLKSDMKGGDFAALARHFSGTTIPHRPPSAALVRPAVTRLTTHLRVDRSSVALGDDAVALSALLDALASIKVESIRYEDDPYETYTVPTVVAPNSTALEAALSRPQIADLLAEALIDLPPHKWAITSAAVQILGQWSRQRMVGVQL